MIHRSLIGRNESRLSLAAVVITLMACLPFASAQEVRVYDYANPLESSRDLQPTTQTRQVDPVELVQLVLTPGINLPAVQREDAFRESQAMPYRFAIPHEVFYTPDNSGTWEQVDPDTWIWRLRIISPEAASINLGFTSYTMPEGGTLFVYATDRSQVIRGFTTADNEDHGELWVPPVFSDDIIVELTLPTAVKDQMVLALTRINHGYRGFNLKGVAGDKALLSGSCNVDVNCPEGVPWQDQIAGVAAIVIEGSFACTGFMINNATLDRKPYFMTAFHCGLNATNAASLIAFWNYENSTCRTPGSASSGAAGNGSLTEFNSGSIFRAGVSNSDFTLVQLDDNPDPTFGVTFLGWDRSAVNPPSAVGIHHPNVEEKRISFSILPTTTTSWGGTASPGDGTHVRITEWNLGTTEGGSSGSPLFDANHRVIGQLHGGGAACGNDLSDWYGRFSRSWTGGGTSSTRLSNWLDPFSSGVFVLDTLDALVDCDSNGIHDPQEIAGDPSLDCQSNGILDSCELGSSVVDNFEAVGALIAKGWAFSNNSSIITQMTPGWQEGNPAVFSAQAGSVNSYIMANFQSTDDGAGIETISSWMMTPEVDLIDGKTFSFWTRKVTETFPNQFPDRLEVRLSTNGASINVGSTTSSVGDFTTVLTTINPTLTITGYPVVWTRFDLVLSGIGSPTTGRFAFRYFVTDAGPLGTNSNFIGIDTVEYISNANDTNANGIPDECEGTSSCVADINQDGQVSTFDLLALLITWGDCPVPCSPGVINQPQDTCAADGNRDCIINTVDLLTLLTSWGPCP